MKHELDGFMYALCGDSKLKMYSGCQNVINSMKSYEYGGNKPNEKIIEGECIVIDIDGKKLIEVKE